MIITYVVVRKVQKQTTVIRTRLKVTTCLYLKPNSRASSLSTLIALTVNKDNKPKIPANLPAMPKIFAQRLTPPYSVRNNNAT